MSRDTPTLPFWQWKEQQYAKDQASETPHSKEWYYRAYGGYCEQVRHQESEKDELDDDVCQYCNGDGGDPLNDYVLPCPCCQGDG